MSKHRALRARRTVARPLLTTTGSLVAVGALGLAMAPAASAQAPKNTPARTGVPTGTAAALAPSPAAAATVQTVVVVRGDTVSKIAARTGRSTSGVLAANGLTARSVIYPGQVLQLGEAAAPAAVMAAESGDAAATPQAATIIALAASLAGTPYAYGEESPARGFDCSGLVQYVYGANGVRLPRTVAALRSTGTRVSAADAQPGDLVLFADYNHVAIYVGNGRIIDSPRTGSVVSERDLWTDRVTYRRVL